MRYTIGQQIHFVLDDFEKPLKQFKHKNTDYLLYEVKIIKRNTLDVPEEKHQLQIPIKTVWTKLYRLLEEKESLPRKDIPITIVRDRFNNYNYIITIH